MSAEWLHRGLTTCAYCYCLCLSEEAYYKELDKLGVSRDDAPPFKKTPHSNAVTNLIQRSAMKDVDHPVAIVCMSGWEKHEPIVVAGLLVHEAVHIWQAHAVHIGSFNDHGDEEEAYAIQWLSQQLMWSFMEQTK